MKNKSIEEIKARYSLSCDGWIPVEADDWSHLVNSYDELLKENKRKDKLIMDLADRLNTALCWIPKEDWNCDFGESFVLCGKILDDE